MTDVPSSVVVDLSDRLKSGGGGPSDEDMLRRIQNLEESVNDVKVVLARIEQKLDSKASTSALTRIEGKLDGKAGWPWILSFIAVQIGAVTALVVVMIRLMTQS